jgi:hypothetical protein
MRTKSGCLLTVAPIMALSVLVTAPARAEVTKDQCVDANGEAQELRREGKLSAARDKLVLCSNRSCPAMVRDDCTKRLDELEKAQPTVAFEAKDAAGNDVSVVKVTVDGKPLADKLDGTALRVDVGQHVFTFEVVGQPPVTRTLVMTEGEKGRQEVVAIGAASPATSAPTFAAAPPRQAAGSQTPAAGPLHIEQPATTGGMGTQRVFGLVSGGIGLAGVALGSVFGALTIAQKNQQNIDCASSTSCTSHANALGDHSTGMTNGTVSTAAFIAGGALLVGGALLFFTGGPAAEQLPTTGMVVVPSVGPGGGGMLLRGAF